MKLRRRICLEKYFDDNGCPIRIISDRKTGYTRHASSKNSSKNTVYVYLCAPKKKLLEKPPKEVRSPLRNRFKMCLKKRKKNTSPTLQRDEIKGSKMGIIEESLTIKKKEEVKRKIQNNKDHFNIIAFSHSSYQLLSKGYFQIFFLD